MKKYLLVALFAITNCGTEHLHPSYSYLGMDVYPSATGNTTNKNELVIATDLYISLLSQRYTLPSRSLEKELDGYRLYFRDNKITLSNGKQTTGMYSNARYILIKWRTCIADSSYLHELGHVFGEQLIKTTDYKHENKDFWKFMYIVRTISNQNLESNCGD